LEKPQKPKDLDKEGASEAQRFAFKAVACASLASFIFGICIITFGWWHVHGKYVEKDDHLLTIEDA